jgi:hypothetical protein
MKRILLYGFIGFTVLILLLIGIIRFYQEPIKNAVIDQANNQLVDAKLTFEQVNLSIFADFPNLQLSLQKVALVSTIQEDLNYFLANELSLSVNVWKYLRDKVIEVNSVGAKDIQLYAWTGANGELSLLSLLKETEEPNTVNEVASDSTSASEPLNFAVSDYAISIKELVYVDSISMMQLSLSGMENNGSFSGSGNSYALKNESSWQEFSFSSDGTNWIDKANGSLSIVGLVDQAKSIAMLNQLNVRWNGVPLVGNGEIGYADLDALDMDISLITELTSLAKLFESLPETYQNIPKSYDIAGDFSLNVTVKGLLETAKENYPAINLSLALKDGNFKALEDLSDLENIFVDFSIEKPQGSLDLANLAIKRFETKVGQGFVKATATITEPFTRTRIKAKIDAQTNLQDWQVLLASYTNTLAGELEMAITVDTEMAADGQSVKVDDRSVNGFMKLNNAKFNAKELPLALEIPLIDLIFAPNAIKLNASEWGIGNSTFSAKGTLTSLMDYVMSADAVLDGNLEINSQDLDLDELSVAFSDTSETDLVIIPLPKNIHFTAKTKIEKLIYGEVTYSNLNGNLKLENQELSFDAVKGNFLNGSILLSGNYSASDEQSASTKMSVSLKDIDLGEAGQYIQLLNKYVPILKEASGKMEMAFSMNTSFKSGFEPDWSTLNANGLFEAVGASVKSPAMGKISSSLKVGDWNTLSSSKLAARFNLVNGNLIVQPFNLNIAGNEAAFGGEISVNGGLKLNGDIAVPAKMLNNLLSQNLKLDNALLDKKLNIPFGFTGTLTNPKLTVNTAAATDSYKSALNTKVQENVAALKAKAQERAAKIMQEAEGRIANLSVELDKGLASLTAEKDSGVQSLLNAAGSNPFKKAAAELAAKKLNQQSDNKMEQLRNRILAQMESIRTSANAEAEKVLKDADQ